MSSVTDAHNEKHKAALASLAAAFALTALKLAVGLYTNSLGILSEALHSGLDLLAAAMTVWAVRISAMPADARHPYGHGKVENLSALAQTLLLFITCAWVVYEGVHRLTAGSSPVTPSLWGVGVMLISIVVDINRVRVLRRVAKAYKSQALEADALHFSTDILSSAVVLAGVLAVWVASVLNLPEPLYEVLAQADTVAALLVAVIIFRAGLQMASKAVNILMDSGSDAEREAVVHAVTAVPGIIDVRRVRLRTGGPQTFVDLTVGVAPGIRVSEGHRLAHAAEHAVEALLAGSDVTVHVEPRVQAADTDNPFVLVQRLASEHALPVHNVQIVRSGAAAFIELHVELPGALPFVQGYKRVRAFEDDLREQCTAAEVVTHIEPEGTGANMGFAASVSVPLAETAWREVRAMAAMEPLLGEPHGFSAYELPEQGVCISFHCSVDATLSVEAAHRVCTRLEKQLRTAMPVLGRIIIHLEPPAELR